MKTLMIPLIAVVSILTSCSSSRSAEGYYSNRSQGYYYYPSANVYYDGGRSCYIYNNGRNWISASTLPNGFSIGNDRVKVFYNGPEVWRDNDRHRRAYYKEPRDDDRRDRRREARYRDRNY